MMRERFWAYGDLRAVCLFRVCAGPLVIAHLWPFLRDAISGHYYRDGFYVPWFTHYPELPLPLYGALLGFGCVASVALSCGVAARAAACVCFGVVAYNFFLSETFFHHNRAFLLTFLFGLSCNACGDSLTLRPQPAPPPRRLWPLWLWRSLACVPYLASSISKLLDPDWFGGVVTWDRVERYRHAAERYVPVALVDLAARESLHVWLAKVVIALELAIGLGLWFSRTRVLAVWLAVVFHLLIQASANIQVFSLLGIAGLAIWTTPRTRDRRLELRLDDPSAARLARWTQRLDWLARFELHFVASGPAIALHDRDGQRLEGRRAVWHVLARLPATAFVGLPAIGFGLSW
ncbi:MAG: HTTM domain-containing protein [Polyangiales bacterium]